MDARGRELLLAEDDGELREMLVELLSSAGYRVDAVRDGVSARQRALTHAYDLMVLDRGLPLLDGLDLLAALRRSGWTVPVLILSAYGTAMDRVAGLDAGAEDYLAKPFDVDELLARLRALLRRHLDGAETYPIPGGVLDPRAHAVVLDAGRGTVALSPGESALLGLLAAQPARVFTRQHARDTVFGNAESAGMIDTYVYYLRRKLGRAVIRTVRGLGYQLGEPERGPGRRGSPR